MANVNIDRFPYTVEHTRYRNGVDQNYRIKLSLDPTDTPLLWTFSTEIFTGSSNKALMVLTPNVEWPTNTQRSVIDGDIFELFKEVFTARSSNPGQGEFFSGPYSDRLLIYNSLADQINQNPNLNYRFYAQVVFFFDWLITIEAKNIGSIYNFGGNYATAFQQNSNPVSNVISSVDLDRGMKLQSYNYKVFTEIWQKEPNQNWGIDGFTGVDNLIATINSNYNFNNQYTFDISTYLKPLLKKVAPSPRKQYNNFTLLPDFIINYYLKYGEQFNGGYNNNTGLPTDSPINITNYYSRKYFIGQTEPRWATYGSFDLNINPANNTDYWQSFYSDFVNGDMYYPVKIATTQPEYKLRRRTNFPEFVQIFLYNEQKFSSIRNYRLKSDYTYADGTTVNNAFTHITNNINVSGLYLIDTSYLNLAMFIVEATKRVLFSSHTVQVFRNGGWVDYSLPFTYSWDTNDELDSTYIPIYWENPLRTLDNFIFEGVRSEEVTTRTENYSTSLFTDPGVFRDRPQLKVLKTNFKKIFTINSGWVDAEHYRWLQTLLSSNRVFTVVNYEVAQQIGIVFTENEPTYWSINIEDFDYTLDSTRNLYNLRISYTYAIEENNLID